MKNIFIVWLLMGLSSVAVAQTITIQDKETGEPIDMVVLASDSPSAFESTDEKGTAVVSAFKGADVIMIRKLGYLTTYKSYQELDSVSFQLELVPSTITMDHVVVSASRWNQKSSDVPSKIISISNKDIVLQSPQTAADLLGISGKVFIQKSQQGGGSPMIRGFATNRLLYTIDGVRMNTAIFRGGNVQNVISLDPFAIQHTEVFFGPGSVIYGSDAIGGVMSFQTITPEFSTTSKPLITGKAVGQYASANNERSGHFDVNVGWKKWAMVSSLSTNNYDDLKMGSRGPDEYLNPYYVQRIDGRDVVVANEDSKIQKPSGYSQINMMQKVRFSPNENWDIQYGFHYSQTSDYARYDRHIRYRDGIPRYGEWSYGPQKWMMNNVDLTHSKQTMLYDQMTFRLAQQYFEESRYSRDINSADREIRIEEVDAYSANLDFIKSVGARNKLFYGAEMIWNGVTSIGINENIIDGTSEPGPARYPASTWSSVGAYVTDQFKMSDKVLLQAGLRYSQNQLHADFDPTFFNLPFETADLNSGALTGSVGIVYRPAPKWVISTNLASAFRAPNVDDVGKVFDSEPGSVVVPNPALKSEYAYNADLSIAHIFGESIKLDVTAYFTQLQNALVRRNFTLNGLDSIMYAGELSQVQAMQNAAVANIYGFQAGLDIKLPAGFGIASDFNYQIGEEELDDGTVSPSRHAAPWFGVTKLSYKTDKLRLLLSAVYSGEKAFEDMPLEEIGKAFIYAKDENGNPYSPGWCTINFKAMYQLNPYFSVTTGLENITDLRYRPFSSGIVAPGRNFTMSLRYTF